MNINIETQIIKKELTAVIAACKTFITGYFTFYKNK